MWKGGEYGCGCVYLTMTRCVCGGGEYVEGRRVCLWVCLLDYDTVCVWGGEYVEGRRVWLWVCLLEYNMVCGVGCRCARACAHLQKTYMLAKHTNPIC